MRRLWKTIINYERKSVGGDPVYNSTCYISSMFSEWPFTTRLLEAFYINTITELTHFLYVQVCIINTFFFFSYACHLP